MSVFHIFSPIKKFIKRSEICIDNLVFRLHGKLTFVILLGFSLFVTSYQYIGDPIDCIVNEIPAGVMDAYCWVHSTFTIPSRFLGKVGQDLVHPGVASHVPGKDQEKYHTYYQWVCFVLFFQAVCFYIPRYLWKYWEGGLIKALVDELNDPLLPKKFERKNVQRSANFLITNRNKHNFYAVKFFFCELLNLVNVLLQICLTDLFLDGEFSKYGAGFLSRKMGQEDLENPMDRVFPKLTKCTFYKYGPTGSIQLFDGLCVLPLNVVNEKIYLFLWFWFIFLSIVSGLCLFYRICIIAMPPFRLYLLKARSKWSSLHKIQTVLDQCQIGDWFLLYLLSKNIKSLNFERVIAILARRLAAKSTFQKAHTVSV